MHRAPTGALAGRATTHREPGRARGWERVETRLPVGGTWITEHDLFGTWRVEVYLDTGRRTTTTASFVLGK